MIIRVHELHVTVDTDDFLIETESFADAYYIYHEKSKCAGGNNRVLDQYDSYSHNDQTVTELITQLAKHLKVCTA